MSSMSNHRAQEALYESEAALRLVDHELSALHEVQDAPVVNQLTIEAQRDMALRLERANSQIIAVLTRLREGRAAIENTAVGKVKLTQDKLREVTSATEDAATNIMDACDRANSLVDELDGIVADPGADATKSVAIRGSLRDELFVMMGALQFQDITSQQLAHASAVLDEMEQRMIEVAKLFDPSMTFELPKTPAPADNKPLSYDANATTRDADSRQAVADEIFTTVKVHAA